MTPQPAFSPDPPRATPPLSWADPVPDRSLLNLPYLLTAGQMDRIILRKSKLTKANQLRNRSRKSALERPHFWYDSLPEPPFEAHTVESLHRLVQDLFLQRWDDYLEELQKARRAGRPKSKEQVEVEEIKRQEEAEYDSGFGVSSLALWSRAGDLQPGPLSRRAAIGPSSVETVGSLQSHKVTLRVRYYRPSVS